MALAGDLLQALAGWFFRSNLSGGLKRVDSGEKSTGVDDLPPIVLVHGIFGFGKGIPLLLFVENLSGISSNRHYPEYSGRRSHFVGHSAGAQVIRVLQQMLADKAFDGYENTSPNWVLSITSLSGAFNGTTRIYLDGMQPDNGKSVKPASLLQLCRLGVISTIGSTLYYNFKFDHFNLSQRKTGIWGLVCLLGKTGPCASGDWILPDLTIQGSIRLNAHI
ncbi:alpha/beta-Hydrolases superfamily protein [Striga hermonthica]|uniref:Alpha/beta-Hydrolases superfamily protein n=1 Tax=Striga hermonthica TaxID=68872 RepID=A0A9N7NNA5_STRHE|nr:alpha/beta-Hydrolases superfamily protein [Striga hermonthica]